MAYEKTEWSNGQAPYINDTNLNKIEQGIYENDNNIGDLNLLSTTNKESVVSAVNEVQADTQELNGRDTFSTTEKVIGKWVDGKPIYRKVLEVSLTSEHSTNYSVAHGISNLGTFTRIDGILIRTAGSYIPINSYSATSYRISVVATEAYLNIQNVGYVGTAKYVLEYTKSTD